MFVKNEAREKTEDILYFVNKLIKNLNTENKAIVLTNKTNRFIIINLKNYREAIFDNLYKNINKIDIKVMRRIKGEASKILKKLRYTLKKYKYTKFIITLLSKYQVWMRKLKGFTLAKKITQLSQLI